MAYRSETTRDEVVNIAGAQSASTSLFKVLGGWGNVNGPGIFMIRTMVAGSTAAVFAGATGAVLGSILFSNGTVPFIACSCLGFTLGATRWYLDSLAQALLNLDRYPALLRLHLDANYSSHRFRTWQLDAFTSERFRKSPSLQSMLVVAWLTAQPALDEVMANEESALVQEAKDKVEGATV